MICVRILNNGNLRLIDRTQQECIDEGHLLIVQDTDITGSAGSFAEFLEYTVNAFNPELFAFMSTTTLLGFTAGWGGSVLINAIYKAKHRG